MAKYLLVTISEDKSYLWGVRFIVNFFSKIHKLNVSLLYVPKEKERGPVGASGITGLDNVDEEFIREENQALKNAEDFLLSSGFKREQVVIHPKRRRSNMFENIIREANEGFFDAVILGRRGISVFKNAMTSETSLKLLEEIRFPFWICRPVRERCNNVLLCCDGCPSSLNMAYHVGYMLADEPEHMVYVLKVIRRESEADPHVITEAERKLMENGLERSRIVSKTVISPSVSDAVLKTLDRFPSGVVAFGRGKTRFGMEPPPGTESVGATLFHKEDLPAIWFFH